MQAFPCEICKIFKNTFFYRIQKFFNSNFEDITNSFFANEQIPADLMRSQIKTEMVSKVGHCFKGQCATHYVKLKIIQIYSKPIQFQFDCWALLHCSSVYFVEKNKMVAIFKILTNTQTHTLAKILRLHTLWLSMFYTQTFESILPAL